MGIPEAAAPPRAIRAAAGLARSAGGALVACGAFATVAGLGASQGGYFPTSWDWAGLALGWAVALALILKARVELRPLELAAVGSLVAFAGWVAVSITWSTSVTQSMLELERDLLYPLGLAAAILFLRRRSIPSLLGGVLAGIVVISAYALTTRLAPDRLGRFYSAGAYRLSTPIGYWNGLGIFAAMGIPLAVGLAARARTLPARFAAGAAAPVLCTTLYFTYSRGAWLALGAALLTLVVLDPRRAQVTAVALLLGAPATAAVVLSSRATGLTNVGATFTQARHDGHRLAVAVAVLAALSGLVALAFAVAERRIRLPRALRLSYGVALALCAAVLLLVVFERYGDPASLTRRAYRSFTGPAVNVSSGGSLNKRLLTLSANNRIELWHLAWHDFDRHRWLGSGAGTYEQYYFQHRDSQSKVRDAHNLYLETLAELGLPGLLLLAVGLTTPLVAAFRGRGQPLVAPAAAAYLAFLLHAAGDWDWELPAIVLAALFCAAALLAGTRTDRDTVAGAGFRPIALLLALALTGVSLLGLLGNRQLSASGSAIDGHLYVKAERSAHRAIRWAPWSSEPWERLGDAQFLAGRQAAARASYRKAIEKDPSDWKLWLGLAVASKGGARRLAAREALRLNPRSAEILANPSFYGLRLHAEAQHR